MDREALGRLEPALEVFLESFAGCAVAPTRRLISTYVRGQLSALPRKSVKPMALEAGVPPRTLQELLSRELATGERVLWTASPSRLDRVLASLIAGLAGYCSRSSLAA